MDPNSLSNANLKKTFYHKSNKMPTSSLEKSGSTNILTSSPVLEQKARKLPDFRGKNNFDAEEANDIVSDVGICQNTIQSVNDKEPDHDVDNHIRNPELIGEELFQTAFKVSSKIKKKETEDHHCIESSKKKKVSEKLIDTINEALEYFKKASDLSSDFNNETPTVNILKEDYDKFQVDFEFLSNENKRLKDKNRMLKESRAQMNGNQMNHLFSENFNMPKLLDSILFLQTKNQELEKEKKLLKQELEDNKKPKLSDESRGKQAYSKQYDRKNQNDHMESLLKEQINCMQKMLVLVQDGKENNTKGSKQKKSTEGESEDSNIHFEESFNVTNVSNSLESPGEENLMHSSEKDFHEGKVQQKRFEMPLKAFEKRKKNENVIDEDARMPKLNKNQNWGGYQRLILNNNNNNPLPTGSKNPTNVIFNVNSSQNNKKSARKADAMYRLHKAVK